MTLGDADVELTDLADGPLSGPDWEAWRASHPQQAAQVVAARRVHLLLAELRAVSLFVVVLALSVLGIDIALLVTAITIVIAAFGLALGLALGLGARPIAYQILAGYYVRQRFRPGQAIQLEQIQGEVSGTGSVNTVLTRAAGAIVVPNSLLIERTVGMRQLANAEASAADE